ncbi:MAG: type II toxin-antitoxin system VapC family toxin [Albidovulum sp.]|nr:type II toxin-antitoxin system VapC family toxin [Albidovulum sp.]MDE0303799.1 type II toxin-antitoxin system VapC family toxin [Albidovulum sp.]MDE0532763.1 type II toxin-antitoxin system VapC family toxin [Albidovulum sp.]
MTLLVDTHLVLWAAYTPERLSPTALARVTDEEQLPHVSAASIWEVVIKAGLGRADFKVDPAKLRAGLAVNGWTELPITTGHALEVAKLPPLHADPFDRILIAQARREGWPLITRDRALEGYGPPVELV